MHYSMKYFSFIAIFTKAEERFAIHPIPSLLRFHQYPANLKLILIFIIIIKLIWAARFTILELVMRMLQIL